MIQGTEAAQDIAIIFGLSDTYENSGISKITLASRITSAVIL